MTTIFANLQDVRARIAAACAIAGRDRATVDLIAVSKNQPASALREAILAGQRAFGESYVQEALPKQAALKNERLEWHFIGPIQSNKTRAIATHFDWVHGIDRLSLAERLSAQRPVGCAPLNVCVQVNVSGEVRKHGCTPAETSALCRAVAALPALRLRGLMTIPEPAAHGGRVRERFALLRQHFDLMKADGLALDTLSMGMSDDLEAAIAEGATLVRIGTAIFGERQYTA